MYGIYIYVFPIYVYKWDTYAYEWSVETSHGRETLTGKKGKIINRFTTQTPSLHPYTHPPTHPRHSNSFLYFVYISKYTGAYLLRPYLSGRDAHFVMMSDLYRVDDLIIIGTDVPHQLLILSIIPQEPFHFPWEQIIIILKTNKII